PDDWVLVHDAARPCVRQTDIENLIIKLANHSVGGILALPVRDTMKRSNPEAEIVETVEREGLWHALTPQMFRLELLFNALQTVLNNNELVTDEAQAIEKQGFKPLLIAGHADNIKITHPQDLTLAELYLREQQCE
ncbi:MAG: 2-C-methyl-D-erythritol 4-phosphate cytidylyltransferase, partial [Mycoplasmataceae bacterium]|nr:2-C-methyl-D-erythritol 4-phosphate cytidylyltransferase [Mycoplasmataceae bacterium]